MKLMHRTNNLYKASEMKGKAESALRMRRWRIQKRNKGVGVVTWYIFFFFPLHSFFFLLLFFARGCFLNSVEASPRVKRTEKGRSRQTALRNTKSSWVVFQAPNRNKIHSCVTLKQCNNYPGARSAAFFFLTRRILIYQQFNNLSVSMRCSPSDTKYDNLWIITKTEPGIVIGGCR